MSVYNSRRSVCDQRLCNLLSCLCLIVLGLLAVTGCATLGQRQERALHLAGAPTKDEVIADLTRSDRILHSFEARGEFILISPQVDDGNPRRFQGRIAFRKPTDVSVIGRHRISGTLIFRLRCIGKEYFVEFPTENECYYQLDGEQVEGIPFSVSPSDIAREMFLAESWASLRKREVHLVEFDNISGAAVVTIGDVEHPRRRLEIVKLALGGWVVAKNELLSGDETIAITTSSEYFSKDGVNFPTRVEARFPKENTELRFHVSDPRVNIELPDSLFHIDRQAAIKCISN